MIVIIIVTIVVVVVVVMWDVTGGWRELHNEELQIKYW
jgi:hypothetical protein